MFDTARTPPAYPGGLDGPGHDLRPRRSHPPARAPRREGGVHGRRRPQPHVPDAADPPLQPRDRADGLAHRSGRRQGGRRPRQARPGHQRRHRHRLLARQQADLRHRADPRGRRHAVPRRRDRRRHDPLAPWRRDLRRQARDARVDARPTPRGCTPSGNARSPSRTTTRRRSSGTVPASTRSTSTRPIPTRSRCRSASSRSVTSRSPTPARRSSASGQRPGHHLQPVQHGVRHQPAGGDVRQHAGHPGIDDVVLAGPAQPRRDRGGEDAEAAGRASSGWATSSGTADHRRQPSAAEQRDGANSSVSETGWVRRRPTSTSCAVIDIPSATVCPATSIPLQVAPVSCGIRAPSSAYALNYLSNTISVIDQPVFSASPAPTWRPSPPTARRWSRPTVTCSPGSSST